jgi:hypothetical protein
LLAYDAQVPRVKRLLLAIATAIGLVTYVWFAAVRAVPRVRRRKAAARAARRRQG